MVQKLKNNKIRRKGYSSITSERLEEILERRGLLKKEVIFEHIFKNPKTLSISRVILLSLLAAGILTIGVAAPGTLRIFQLFKRKYKKNYLTKTKNRIAVLKKRRFITIDSTPKGLVISLTQEGRKKALQYYLKILSLGQKKWDGKWRVVVFDIPNKLNTKRNALREFLRYMGFKKIQKSIYVLPYPCREELWALAEYLQITPYIKFFEGSIPDEEKQLKKLFRIS